MHCAALTDTCHLKNWDLEPKFQKYKGRVVLRGDRVKTILILKQFFFTGHGSSASQMTAAKVVDATARLPDMQGMQPMHHRRKLKSKWRTLQRL